VLNIIIKYWHIWITWCIFNVCARYYATFKSAARAKGDSSQHRYPVGTLLHCIVVLVVVVVVVVNKRRIMSVVCCL